MTKATAMMRPGGCGHQHDNPLDALACETMSMLYKRSAASGAVVLIEDGTFRPHVSMVGNTAGMAGMAAAICALATRDARPTDCAACAEAHDRMLQALAILRLAPTRC